LWDTMLENLIELGFTREQSASALLNYNMDSDHAAEVLFQSPDRHVSSLRQLIRRWRLRAVPDLASRLNSGSNQAALARKREEEEREKRAMEQRIRELKQKQKEDESRSLGLVIPLYNLPPSVLCSCCHTMMRRSSALRSAVCSHIFCRDCWIRKICKVMLKLHGFPTKEQHPLPRSVFDNISITCPVSGCMRRIPLIAVLRAMHLDELGADSSCARLLAECDNERMQEVQRRRRREKLPVNVIIPVKGLSSDTLVMYSNWLYSNHDGSRVKELLDAHVLSSAARPDKQLFPIAQIFQDNALQSFCMNFMCQDSSITATNINDVYKSAVRLENSRLKKTCEDFIKSHLVDFYDHRAIAQMERWNSTLLDLLTAELDYQIHHCSNYWVDIPFSKYCVIINCTKKLDTLKPAVSNIACNMLSNPPLFIFNKNILDLLRILVSFSTQRSYSEARLAWVRGTKLLTQIRCSLEKPAAIVKHEVARHVWDEFILRLKEFFSCLEEAPTPGPEPACMVCGGQFGVFKGRVECAFCRRFFCKKCLVPPIGELPRAMQTGATADKKVCPYCNSILALLASDTHK